MCPQSKAKHSNSKEKSSAEADFPATDSTKAMAVLFNTYQDLSQASCQRGDAFPVGAFIVKNLKQGIHPLALNDGLTFLKKCWEKTEPVKDPWALALSTAKTCNQKYITYGFNFDLITNQYGPFFLNKKPQNNRGR
jgi:hypothetical protein